MPTPDEPVAESSPTVSFPRGDVFAPLIADPKEAETYLRLVGVRSVDGNHSEGQIGIGQNFGLYRWPGRRANEGWQVGIVGAAWSQFDMNTPSKDLLNTDFLIALPLSLRTGAFSARLRAYHQSSHLGDESLLHGTAPARVDIDFEALEAVAAWDITAWRAYVGGDYIVRGAEEGQPDKAVRLGLDYHGKRRVLWGARAVGGLDVRWAQQSQTWDAGSSVKVGLEFGTPFPVRRGTRLMLEAYHGYGPFGQFYTRDITYGGLGFYLDY
jgi:hypothetical protein